MMPLLQTFLLAMTPIGELRAAIPFGIANGINPLTVYLIAVIGNIIPVFFLMPFFNFLERKLIKPTLKTNNQSPAGKTNPAIAMFFSLYKRWRGQTHRLHSRRFNRLGAFALISFVAVPIPLTGAWSGALAAVIFGIPIKKSAPLIFIGVLIAGLIVSAISMRIF